MLRTSKVDPKKEEQERLQGFLLDMLKEEENKYCADCQSKTPRWASWNLGIFICIRCAGIHRNLGVHISKVRSVNLDSWSAEQVQTMRVMGNEKARKVYEFDLPPQFRRPTTDSQMEQFIRSKYEQKRYMQRDWKYPNVDVADLPKSLTAAKKSQPIVNFASATSPAQRGARAAPAVETHSNDLLDFDLTGTTTSEAVKPQSATPNLLDSLGDLSLTNKTSSAVVDDSADQFDDFGSFVSASAAQSNNVSADLGFADFSFAPSVSPNEPVSSGLNDLASVSNVDFTPDNGKKTTADILSLFGPSSDNGNAAAGGPVLVAPGGFTAFGLQAARTTQTPTAPVAPQYQFNNGLGHVGVTASSNAASDPFGGLGGLSFAPQPPLHQQPHQNHFATVTSPTKSSFSIPDKSNAFADLSLGQVMKTTYGQNALHTTSSISPKPSTVRQPSPSIPQYQQPAAAPPPAPVQNDLFDMFSSVPPPVTAKTSSGLDDLLGF